MTSFPSHPNSLLESDILSLVYDSIAMRVEERGARNRGSPIADYMAMATVESLMTNGYEKAFRKNSDSKERMGILSRTIEAARKIDPNFTLYDCYGDPRAATTKKLNSDECWTLKRGRFCAMMEEVQGRHPDLCRRCRHEMAQWGRGLSDRKILDLLCKYCGNDWPKRWPEPESQAKPVVANPQDNNFHVSGNGGSRALTATAGGYEWVYCLKDGKAIIGYGGYELFSYGTMARLAVRPTPEGHLDIPSELDGHRVVGIGSLAFFGCDGMTSVKIPAGVECIGSRAFYHCRNLKSVDTPDTLRTVMDCAFVECDFLKSFNLRNCLQFSGDSFTDCPELSKLTLRDGRTDYSSRDGVIYAENGKRLVFWPRTSNEAIVPDGVTTIGAGAFGDSSIRKIRFPKSLRRIEKNAFAACNELDGLVIGEGVEAIDSWVFARCCSLQSIVLPSTLKNVGVGIFDRDNRLAKIAFKGDAPVREAHPSVSVFGNIPRKCEILVLDGSKGWKGSGASGFPKCWPDDSHFALPLRVVSSAEMERLVAGDVPNSIGIIGGASK